MFKRVLIILISSLLFLNSLLAPFAIAMAASPAPTPAPENTWYNSSFEDWYSKVYDPGNPSEIFGERYTAAQVQWVIYGLFSFIINQTTNQNLLVCLFANAANVDACTSLISSLTTPSNVASVPQEKDNRSLLSLVFATDRPFSGIGYVKEKVDNFSLVPIAHAQTLGFGFNALSPIQKMWQASRDMAFGLFVIVAIVFAFMIMFRVKISPQVVISVQTAIPKVIGALILVTFSYAIAGFLIDLMYLVYGIISVMGVGFVPITPTAVGLFKFLTVGQVGAYGSGPNLGILGLFVIYLILFPIIFLWLLFLYLGVLGVLFVGWLGSLAGGLAASVSVAGIPILKLLGTLILIIIIIMILWNTLKTLFALLKAFVNILLLTVFAPLQIVAGTVLPNFGFSSWLRSFVSNLAVFVTTSVLILFAFIFLIMAAAAPWTGNPNLNPWANFFSHLLLGEGKVGNLVTGSPEGWPPLIGGQGLLGLLFLGVSFVLFSLVPKATEVVQGLISGKPFAYGTAIGEVLGPVGPMSGKIIQGAAVGSGASWVSNRLGNIYTGMTPAQQNTAFARLLTSIQTSLNNLQKP